MSTVFQGVTADAVLRAYKEMWKSNIGNVDDAVTALKFFQSRVREKIDLLVDSINKSALFLNVILHKILQDSKILDDVVAPIFSGSRNGQILFAELHQACLFGERERTWESKQ